MHKLAFAVAGMVCILAPAAWAEWFVKVDPPDVFGNKNVMAEEGKGEDALVIECDKTKLDFAYLMKKREFQEIPEADADFLVQVDEGTPTTISAILSSWNDNYAGIISRDRSSDVIGILHSIANAKQRINVGAIVNGHKLTGSFDAVGSTAAMATVFKECELDGNGKPAQPSQ